MLALALVQPRQGEAQPRRIHEMAAGSLCGLVQGPLLRLRKLGAVVDQQEPGLGEGRIGGDRGPEMGHGVANMAGLEQQVAQVEAGHGIAGRQLHGAAEAVQGRFLPAGGEMDQAQGIVGGGQIRLQLQGPLGPALGGLVVTGMNPGEGGQVEQLRIPRPELEQRFVIRHRAGGIAALVPLHGLL